VSNIKNKRHNKNLLQDARRVSRDLDVNEGLLREEKADNKE
jgi:hypothetical protein